MKMRESGMPEREFWESLFDPDSFIGQLFPDADLHDVAEFGCGYGTFTIPLAKRITGHVFALDLDSEMLKATYQAARDQSIDNITILQCDFLSDGALLSTESVDGVFIAHILHGTEEENLKMLSEAHRVLKPGGLLAVLHWRSDVDTPRGPPLEFRLSPSQALEVARNAGFSGDSDEMLLGDYHWGLRIYR